MREARLHSRRRRAVMSADKAGQLVSAFALAFVEARAMEDPEWARALKLETVQYRLAVWIRTLEDDAVGVLVGAAHLAWQRRDGQSLVTVLRLWLGLAASQRESDRLLALDWLLEKKLAKVAAAGDPLVYLSGAVDQESRRMHRESERGGRGWARILLPAPAAGDETTNPVESLARDDMHPEERGIRVEDSATEARQRDTGRPRPALARLLAVVDQLRSGGISDVEHRLLRLLEMGLPPAAAERLAGCGHGVYVNLIQKAQRLSASCSAA